MKLRHYCLFSLSIKQRTTIIRNIIYNFLIFNLIALSRAAILVDYTEKQVWDYVRYIPRENLTQKCAASLDKVSLIFS